ncbi:MarR family winged helix-turn-helix transcriptional regulator [Kordiimonas laminariae]|uniref:MarR family winged helix-turn-helix transcriptional regulator n=1 Tax=Kordiimonas laminariae TaxID=2917717 RepID=UPI001FF632B7|nr:MarR family transcriptional regulator [Kordiimonas laminariae]
MSRHPQPNIPDDLTLDKQLCFAVHSASNAIDQLYRPLLNEHGLTYTQYITLMALAEEDGITITELATKIGVGKATMTPLLRRLDDKGLISRTIPKGNERQKIVEITDAGLSSLEGSCYVTDKVFSETGLTDSEAVTLISLCKKLVKASK